MTPKALEQLQKEAWELSAEIWAAINPSIKCKDIYNKILAAMKEVAGRQSSTPHIELIDVNDRSRPAPKEGEFYVLYDNGEITKYSDEDQPFAIATHWFLPKVASQPIERESKDECPTCKGEGMIDTTPGLPFGTLIACPECYGKKPSSTVEAGRTAAAANEEDNRIKHLRELLAHKTAVGEAMDRQIAELEEKLAAKGQEVTTEKASKIGYIEGTLRGIRDQVLTDYPHLKNGIDKALKCCDELFSSPSSPENK